MEAIAVTAAGRVDISEHVSALCERVGLKPSYVAEMRLTPDTLEVDVYHGRDGLCEGAKFITYDGEADHAGHAAFATLRYPVIT